MWEAPQGPSAYFVTCPACTRSQWISLRRPWLCRACHSSVEEQQLHSPVDRVVRFVETSRAGGLFAMPDLGEPFTDEELGLREELEEE